MAGTKLVVMLSLGAAACLVVVFIVAYWAMPSGAKSSSIGGGRNSSQVRPHAKLDFAVPPDTRPSSCDPIGEDPIKALRATVSIVIPYLNEEWEYILGTVSSILHFTPDELIEQIIFVSDGNRNPRNDELEALSPKIKVLVLHRRHGLIRAKMKGMELVTAPSVVFLEPHCIVNKRWLEPLLVHIEELPRALAMPVLDAIPQDDFTSYHRAAVGHFRLEWNFNLIYTAPAGLEDSPKTYPSPATSGGIFAMRSDWFRHLELFDVGMRQWGGDHVELTMKAWRCGGRIDIVPCSRVGHMFRDSVHQPYTVKVQQIVRNYARLANVWTDRHINAFFKVKPEARHMETGDLKHLHAQREKLKCKNMDWYLKHVDFELGWEVGRICIPGAARSQGGCRGKAVVGRSTIDQLMPVNEYLKARSSATDEVPALPGNDSSSQVPEASVEDSAPAPSEAEVSSRQRGRQQPAEPRRPAPAVEPADSWVDTGDQRWEAAKIVDVEEEEL